VSGSPGTVSIDAATRITLAGNADYWSGDTQTYDGGSAGSGDGVFVSPTANSVFRSNASGGPAISFDNVYFDHDGQTVTFNATNNASGDVDLNTDRLVFYRGTLDLGTNSTHVGTSGDFVVLGSSYDATDTDRTGTSPGNTFFAYPGAALVNDPGAGNYTSAFSSLAGAVIDVGANFYVNGADMSDTAPWDLVLQNNESSNPIANPPFGDPYAVAFNMTVAYSDVQGGSVSAAEPNGGQTNNGVTDGFDNDVGPAAIHGDGGDQWRWNFTGLQITSAAAVYDDVIRVTFNQPVENNSNEISSAVSQLSVDGNSDGDSTTGGGGISFINSYVDSDASPNAAPFDFVSTDGQGDLTTFYVKADGAPGDTWRTDATGGAAGNANSTDQEGADPGNVETDLNVLKGELYAAYGKNYVVNYGYNGDGSFTATADEIRPTLVSIQAGRASHNKPPTTAYDAHNYFHLRYSEPVNLGGLTSNATDTSAQNVRAETTFSGAAEHGGHITETVTSDRGGDGTFTPGSDNGTVSMVGYFNYPGSLRTGSRDSGAYPATSSLYRASPNNENPNGAHGVTLFVVGYSYDPGSGRIWPGYMWGVAGPSWYPHSISDPVGQNGTVPSNPNITDAAGNTLQPSNDGSTDPSGNPYYSYQPSIQDSSLDVDASGPAPDNSWDLWAPGFSTFTGNSQDQETVEIVTRLDSATGFINRLEMYFQDNFAPEDSEWDADPAEHPYDGSEYSASGRSRGLRDSTFDYPDGEESPSLNELLAFRVNKRGVTPLTNTYNTQLETDVNNPLFGTGGPVDDDDPYIALSLDTTHNWDERTNLHVSYTQSEAHVTDLAGVRLPTTAQPVNAIERTPPIVNVALGAVGSRRVYVRFSEPIFGDPNASSLVTKDDFVVSGSQTINSFEPITVEGQYGVIDAWITLSDPISPNFALEGTFGAKTETDPNGIYDELRNAMAPARSFPITDVTMGVVEPVWASDGIQVNDRFGSGSQAVRDFDGSGRGLLPRGITLQAEIKADNHYSESLELLYDAEVPESSKVTDEWSQGLWLPDVIPGFNLNTNTEARAATRAGASDGGRLRDFRIPESDPELETGTNLEFIFRLGGTFAARATDPEDPRSVTPFVVPIGRVIEQRGGVTILNNVIDPTKDDKAILQYEVSDPGRVHVTVFTADSDVVKTLQSGPQGAGKYTYAWDGTNSAGDVVARGIYFIRVKGPGFDEYRKVLVTK
jgi:hypothetical protein